jgi:ComF family protein
VLRTLVDGLLSVLIAPLCPACRNPPESPTRSAVCNSCWNAVLPMTPPFCQVCGDSLSSWRADRGSSRCTRCRRIDSVIALGRSIGEYQGALREIVQALKYERRRSLASPLAALMALHGADVLQGADCVVPVPLHWRRFWSRGFNQSAEIARHLGPPVVRALRRVRHTPPQADLPAARRHANVRAAFAPRRRAEITNACVVLVDDVSTTGATLEACARTLVEAGAREVRTLTAARVVTERRPRSRR